MANITLRKYTGAEEATTWWRDFHNLVALHNYNNDKACRLLPFYLEGAAKVWHQDLAAEVSSAIAPLEAAFKARFKRSTGFDMSVLKLNQRAGETPDNYITRVQSTAMGCNLPQPVLVAIAVNGLLPSTKQWVANKEPKSLEEVRHFTEVATIHGSHGNYKPGRAG